MKSFLRFVYMVVGNIVLMTAVSAGLYYYALKNPDALFKVAQKMAGPIFKSMGLPEDTQLNPVDFRERFQALQKAAVGEAPTASVAPADKKILASNVREIASIPVSQADLPTKSALPAVQAEPASADLVSQLQAENLRLTRQLWHLQSKCSKQ